MLRYLTTAMTLCLGGVATPALAQDAWLQIEAQSSEAGAIAAARDYATRIDGVSAYELSGSNWNAIVVGPFDADDILAQRRTLRAQGLIPADAFTTDGGNFGDQLFTGDDAATLSDDDDATDDTELAQADTAPDPEPQPEPDETPAEARQSEQLLTGDERRELQVALQWAGVYDAGIDGAFGRGTRAAMREWQSQNGYEATGVLTTNQRAALLGQYNAVLDGLGIEVVTDDTAGVTVAMPTDLVEFAEYNPPFAHYDSVEGAEVEARVLLISQRGGQPELYGLYDIMQTLEIVPAEGERERRNDGFTLIGRGDGMVSQTEARTGNGQVKGFTLIWPEGDEERRTRVIDEMLDTFASTPAVMDDVVGEPSEDQSVDLLSGLRIRTPEVTRSGFYVSRRGEVLTTADAVANCGRITLDDDIEATVAAVDEAAGLALLEPSQALAPRQHATFLGGVPRLGTDAILAGYSYDGQLGAPSLTYGALAAMSGLDGNDSVRRYDLSIRSGDAGGPVFDPSGIVMGLLASAAEEGRSLPDGVAFAVDVETIDAFLEGAGVSPRTAPREAALPRGQLERRATDMTVLVGCWE